MALGVTVDFPRSGLMLHRPVGGFHLRSGRLRMIHQASLRPVRCQGGVTPLGSSTHREKLQVALDVVQRACSLCLSVQASMKKGEGQLDKIDRTPVTIADFGVQALVSLELGRLFPGIPLLGEEDASQLRTDYEKKIASGDGRNALVGSIVDVLATVASPEVGKLDCETVLNAIDRGSKALSAANAGQFGQSSYWVLDPIDGTRGFLRGADALYVVGLALVEDGNLVLGVMGSPNVAFHKSPDSSVIQMASMYYKSEHSGGDGTYQRGLVIAASLGGGCWVKPLTESLGSGNTMVKSEVDSPDSLSDAWFCISDNEVWSTLPLARALASGSADQEHLKEQDAQVLPLSCGSLCKYFAVALGGVSAFMVHAMGTTPLKVWDHASGVICVAEAGGQVSDLEGTPLKKLLGNGRETFTVEGGILASNTTLHDLILTRVRTQTAALGQ